MSGIANGRQDADEGTLAKLAAALDLAPPKFGMVGGHRVAESYTAYDTSTLPVAERLRRVTATLQGIAAELEALSNLRPADPSVDELGDQVAAALKKAAQVPVAGKKKRAG